MQLIEYNLPEWAFLDAHSHLGNQLEDRTVILHSRSMSVIEIIDRDTTNFIPAERTLLYSFKYNSMIKNKEVTEQLSAVLHYCATLDAVADREFIINKILRPCAIWYCDYCAWEDSNILNDIFNEE